VLQVLWWDGEWGLRALRTWGAWSREAVCVVLRLLWWLLLRLLLRGKLDHLSSYDAGAATACGHALPRGLHWHRSGGHHRLLLGGRLGRRCRRYAMHRLRGMPRLLWMRRLDGLLVLL
jgi:hypothetical protein